MGVEEPSFTGEGFFSPSPLFDSHHRRLPTGLGGSFRPSSHRGSVGTLGVPPAHQWSRAVSSLRGPPHTRIGGEGSVSTCPFGQFYGGGLYKSTGGYPFPLTVSSGVPPLGVVHSQGHPPYCHSHPGSRESHSRLFVQGEFPPLGMDSSCGGFSNPPLLPPSPPSRSRLVRLGPQCQAPEVLLSCTGPSSLESRRLFIPVERRLSPLCLSAVLPDSQGLGEYLPRPSRGMAGSPLLASAPLVPSPSLWPLSGVRERRRVFRQELLYLQQSLSGSQHELLTTPDWTTSSSGVPLILSLPLLAL